MACVVSLLYLGTVLSLAVAQYHPAGFIPQPPQGVYIPNNNVGWNQWVNPLNQSYNPGSGNWPGAVPGVGSCRQPRDGYQTDKRHDLFVGCVTQFDRLLFVDRFEKYSRWWTTREKIVDYPNFGRGIRRNETITGIWAFDKTSDDSGRVAIIRGGVGHKNVTIKFFSETSGRGFHYLLKIFGH